MYSTWINQFLHLQLNKYINPVTSYYVVIEEVNTWSHKLFTLKMRNQQDVTVQHDVQALVINLPRLSHTQRPIGLKHILLFRTCLPNC